MKDIEEGEQCSRYFFKKSFTKRAYIDKIEDEDKIQDILDIVYDFYNNLFAEKKCDFKIAEDFINLIERKLSKDDQIWLDREIDLQEVRSVVASFPSGKWKVAWLRWADCRILCKILGDNKM